VTNSSAFYKFLGILDRVREKIPHAAITTDIIVGFPGETEHDFEDTLEVVRKARFASAYTFQLHLPVFDSTRYPCRDNA